MGIKLDLEPQELDVVMNQLVMGAWRVVDPVIRKIMDQANGPQNQPQAPQDTEVGDAGG